MGIWVRPTVCFVSDTTKKNLFRKYFLWMVQTKLNPRKLIWVCKYGDLGSVVFGLWDVRAGVLFQAGVRDLSASNYADQF
jgi:hypothetical protein